MNPSSILFLLRLTSAALLLLFLASIFWFLYKDIQSTRVAAGTYSTAQGRLRVIANPKGVPPVNTTYPLTSITTIGRYPRNSIVLDDAYVSGDHALLVWRDLKWWLEDAGSRNGTLLNNMPIREATVISPGDVFSIGDIQLKLENISGNGETEETEE